MVVTTDTQPPRGPTRRTCIGFGTPVRVASRDAALSRDSRYFYVTNPGLFGPSKVDEYRVEKNGDLTLIGNTTPDGAPGQSGLAAR